LEGAARRRRCYTFIVTRVVLALLLLLSLSAFAQKKPPAGDPSDPPEEDAGLRPKEYALNPVQAEKEFKIGLYYAKKGRWRAAVNRFEEAIQWNPGYGDAHYKRAEMLEKLGDKVKAREAWAQFVEAAPDDKRVTEAQKRLQALPAPRGAAAKQESK
jgi:tetratricopeptide (TPR) repeat protein